MHRKLKERIEQQDSKYLDPSERAELVNSFLFAALGIDDPREAIQHPLYWDLICWASQMIALFAIGVEETNLIYLAKATNQHIMSMHYALPDGEPELGPSREEHIKLWHERIEQFIVEETE